MSRTSKQSSEATTGVLSDPQAMRVLLRQFLDSMTVRNYAPETVRRRETQLGDFITWAEQRCWTRVTQITRPIVLRYQRHLFHQPGRNGRTLSFRSQTHRLIALRSWCTWLLRNSHLLHNPASDLELPKLGQCLRGPKTARARCGDRGL